jgi:hypothetical protein
VEGSVCSAHAAERRANGRTIGLSPSFYDGILSLESLVTGTCSEDAQKRPPEGWPRAGAGVGSLKSSPLFQSFFWRLTRFLCLSEPLWVNYLASGRPFDWTGGEGRPLDSPLFPRAFWESYGLSKPSCH